MVYVVVCLIVFSVFTPLAFRRGGGDEAHYLRIAFTRSTTKVMHIAVKTAKKMTRSHRGVSAVNLENSSMSRFMVD